LVRLECRVKPLRLKNAGLLREYDLLFTKFGKLVHSPQAFDLATELRALNGLPTPDAIHVATAILGDCDELWTNDDRMAKAKIPISIRLLT
jgi:predicted nucleic acid-binding protein